MTERVAIVTGGSGGIGRAVAVRLGQAGMTVAVHYAGNRNRAQETSAARRVRAGGAIINFSTSVTKIALTGYTANAATKGAVDAMTLVLASHWNASASRQTSPTWSHSLRALRAGSTAR